MNERLLLRLNPGGGRRLRAGAPWVFSNEIAMRPEYRSLPAGVLVRIEGDDGVRFGTAMFNPRSLIAARVLDPDPEAVIDVAWLRTRLADAQDLRARVTDGPFHRLVHAEADRLPGLVIDRYGEVAVIQANTAGMERLLPAIVEVLLSLMPWRAIVARGDSAARRLEGLPETVALLHGDDAAAIVEEGGVHFPVDLLGGQKTGFFFDQRLNRDRVAGLGAGARVLDLFCHTGAFGLRCLAAGAEFATLADQSQPALEQARAAAVANGLDGGWPFGAPMSSTGLARARNGSTSLFVTRPPSPSRARTRRPACALTAGLRGLRRALSCRAGFCSSRRAAITRRNQSGRPPSPPACIAHAGKVAPCSQGERALTIQSIPTCPKPLISSRSSSSYFRMVALPGECFGSPETRYPDRISP